MPYVFTNPSKDTEVFSCDRVFVLSQKPLPSNLASWIKAKNDGHEDALNENQYVSEVIESQVNRTRSLHSMICAPFASHISAGFKGRHIVL